MDTRDFIARFDAERQALALMDHPNIARVLDAGATETGRPYLVMELVNGSRITDFCDEAQLSTSERLELFTQVCHAVKHAHQKGIIHRDIKPSNVLVTQHDGKPVPKIIDFGIAKATNQQALPNRTLFTAFDQFIGTPAYMSPEQAELSGVDVDTRSDIYSLGVLLYELVTGTTPFDADLAWRAGLDALRRTIREDEPARPSTRLQALPPGELETAAKRRRADPPKLISVIRGDLDWIVMKALEKDRSRRYETAASLAEEIQRLLRNEPIVARPPSSVYRLRKLVRRHRVACAAGGSVLAALVIGLGVAGWALLRERAERSRAEASEGTARTEAFKSAEVSRFLQEMLLSAQPSVARGRDTQLLREMVDNTAERLSRELVDQPEVAADLRSTLGGVYDALGLYPRSESLFRDALATRKNLFGERHVKVAESMHLLASALYHQRKAAEAEPLFRAALNIRTNLLSPDDPLIGQSLNNLALALSFQGKLAEAEKLQREALALQIKFLGSNHLDVATSLHNLASALSAQRRYSDAEPLFRQALAIFLKTYGEDHPDVASVQHSLASVLSQQGKESAAEELFRSTLRIKKKILGADHPEVGATERNLAWTLRAQGKWAEAEVAFREALAAARRGATFSPLDLENCLYDLGSVVVERAWAQSKGSTNSQPIVVKEPASNQDTNAASEAAQLFREYLQLHARSTGTNDWPTANVKCHLGFALTLLACNAGLNPKQREATFAEAEALLLPSQKRLQASTSAKLEFKRKAIVYLVRLYEAWGKRERAAQWKAALGEQGGTQ
jgi:tetratricopeptide (TPR) repeat protein